MLKVIDELFKNHELLVGFFIIQILVVAMFFRFFTVYRCSKELDVYLYIKRKQYNDSPRVVILNGLMAIYGFDFLGASKLIEEAENNNYEWFKQLDL